MSTEAPLLTANRQGREGDPNPIYRTQDSLDENKPKTPRLTEIAGSPVAKDSGIMHVQGPGQMPCDPVAAGLDPADIAKAEPDKA